MTSNNIMAAGIVLALPTLLLALFAGDMVIQINAQPAKPACVTDEDRVHIRRTALEAVDDGLKEHIKVLFAGWIKDPSNQPNRASAGIQAAIVAYQRARADVLRWSPEACEVK